MPLLGGCALRPSRGENPAPVTHSHLPAFQLPPFTQPPCDSRASACAATPRAKTTRKVDAEFSGQKIAARSLARSERAPCLWDDRIDRLPLSAAVPMIDTVALIVPRDEAGADEL